MIGRPPSIRLLIASAVLAPAIAIAALLIWIGTTTSAGLSDKLGESTLGGSTRLVRTQIGTFLEHAVKVGDLFTRRVETHTLDDADLDAWLAPTLDVLVTNAQIAAITYGTANDDAFYLQCMPYGLETCAARGSESEDRQYLVDATGHRSDQPNRVYDYHPSARPWFKEAMAKDEPRWTGVYTWFADAASDATMGCAYVRVARNERKEPMGVICVDVTLNDLSLYLKSIIPTPKSALFVLDAENRLVASSRGSVVRDGERLVMKQSDDRFTAMLGDEMERAATVRSTMQQQRVDSSGQTLRVLVEKLAPYPGIEWKVVAVMPESELLADARETRRRSITLASIVVAAGAFFAFMISRRIARPIERIQKHTASVAAGDFDARIEARGAKELVQLSDNLNRMSVDLKHRVEILQSLKIATEVQQSLLPKKAPTHERLDVHGTSRYCDQTGGDYFDFIEMTQTPGGDLLLAIGDVMGHGIGSAMLMASARGALRAVLLEDADLAAALKRVNQILLQSDSGLFMTMTLMRIHPQSGTAEWASAGHDAAIVFDPADGSFRELEGAEFPLGLMETDFQPYRADGLRSGMILMIGTDGIWEMRSPAQDLYGKERMNQIISTNAFRSAREIGIALEADLEAFRGNEPVHDDVTYVIVKFR